MNLLFPRHTASEIVCFHSASSLFIKCCATLSVGIRRRVADDDDLVGVARTAICAGHLRPRTQAEMHCM